jgi:hypothetical protein
VGQKGAPTLIATSVDEDTWWICKDEKKGGNWVGNISSTNLAIN